MSAFKLGDIVRWTSQAGGSTKDKVGEVVEVVAAGKRPDRERFSSLYTSPGVGWGRSRESYVVMVGKKPYWPRTSALSFVEQAPYELNQIRENVRKLVEEILGPRTWDDNAYLYEELNPMRIQNAITAFLAEHPEFKV